MLSTLPGQQRYVHVTTMRCESLNPQLLGLTKEVSDDLECCQTMVWMSALARK